jgi:receptor protein-tyrosine kinase
MKARPHLAERAVEALQEQARLAPAPRPRPAAPPEVQPAIHPRSAVPAATPVSLGTLEAAGLISRPRDGARTRIVEELALVRQQVLRAMPAPSAGKAARCTRVVLVTSARPGEGKTFTSLNLAGSIAGGGAMPVLLIDADGRRGSLGDMLKLEGKPGLRALAADTSLWPGALVHPTEVPNLSVMTCGGTLGDAPSGEAMADAVRRIAAAFPDHLIVLDTPPALSTSDPSALAPLAGQVVMVVLAEKTQRSEIEAALDVLDACPEIRLLLNRAGLTLNDSFGAYGGYDGYGGADHP